MELKLKDLLYIKQFNISEEQFLADIEKIQKSSSFLRVSSPATINHGIVHISDIHPFVDLYENLSPDFSVCKFIPASGAATRMFKRLTSFYNNPSDYDINEGGFYSVKNTFKNIKKFAFYDKLKECCSDIEDEIELTGHILFNHLNYSNLPKGLIDFHKYENDVRTPLEEHINEALLLKNKTFEIYLSISEEFLEIFQNKLHEILSWAGIDNVVGTHFTFQDKSTDTPALYLHSGKLVRQSDGNILLRPGGHGSLLHNLNHIDADIVFIKNIDNVIHASRLKEIVDYKKLLGGILIDTITKIKTYYSELKTYNSETIINAEKFLKETFGFTYRTEPGSEKEKAALLRQFMNKPVRVCGMVKNTGEPGGGPFWVVHNDGSESLQIVEKSQINLSDPTQKEIFEKSSHFNPVDLVCYKRDPEGNDFDLNNFVDKDSYFVSEKSYDGQIIKVLEHPGLWNGAMADWLTIFVEVPLITFNPVKEINDLLREEHLPQ